MLIGIITSINSINEKSTLSSDYGRLGTTVDTLIHYFSVLMRYFQDLRISMIKTSVRILQTFLNINLQ